jgi:IS5 family transposase
MMENRNGLVVDGLLSRATGEAERLAAEAMLIRRPRRHRRITLGADKAYDAAGFVATCESFRATPHVARNTSGRRSNIADEVAASEGYGLSQRARKRIEEVFAWVKGIAGQDKTRHRGLARVGWQFTLALVAYNLIRLPKLLPVLA